MNGINSARNLNRKAPGGQVRNTTKLRLQRDMTEYKSSASQPPRPLDGQNGPQALGMVMGSSVGAG